MNEARLIRILALTDPHSRQGEGVVCWVCKEPATGERLVSWDHAPTCAWVEARAWWEEHESE